MTNSVSNMISSKSSHLSVLVLCCFFPILSISKFIAFEASFLIGCLIVVNEGEVEIVVQILSKPTIEISSGTLKSSSIKYF